MEFKEVDAITILHDVIEVLRDSIQSKKLQLKIIQNASKHWIFADPTRFQQVFWNILKKMPLNLLTLVER